MPLDMGAGAGGAQMLQEVLARKLQEQQMLAQQRNMREQRALQARGQDITLAGQQAEQDRYNAVQQQKAEAAAAKRESDHAQAGLQAAMQGSFNAAGTDDPNGAKATRDALRVAMRAGGADTRDIPQEQVAKAPKLYAMTVTGPKGEPVHKLVTEAQLQAGVREYRAPQKPDRQAAPAVAQAAQAQQQQQNEVADTLALIKQIEDDKSLNNAVGPMDQYAGGIINADPTGVNRFKALHDQLVGKLSLAQAGKLKGQGQISDKERAMLNAAATALNRGLSEGDYKAELGKIRAQFQRMQGGGAAPAAPPVDADPLGLFAKK